MLKGTREHFPRAASSVPPLLHSLVSVTNALTQTQSSWCSRNRWNRKKILHLVPCPNKQELKPRAPEEPGPGGLWLLKNCPFLRRDGVSAARSRDLLCALQRPPLNDRPSPRPAWLSRHVIVDHGRKTPLGQQALGRGEHRVVF